MSSNETTQAISSEKSQVLMGSENTSAAKILEGRLNQHYQKAKTRTIEKYISYLKFPVFKEKYPEIYKDNSAHLKEIHHQLQSQLKASFTDEVEELCKESNLHSSLCELDAIIKKNEGRIETESWRPTGNPTEDTREHIHQLKMKHKKCLEFILQTFTSENESLEQIMKKKHAEILTVKSRIDKHHQEIKNHFSVVNDPSFMQLEKHMRSNLVNESVN